MVLIWHGGFIIVICTLSSDCPVAEALAEWWTVGAFGVAETVVVEDCFGSADGCDDTGGAGEFAGGDGFGGRTVANDDPDACWEACVARAVSICPSVCTACVNRPQMPPIIGTAIAFRILLLFLEFCLLPGRLDTIYLLSVRNGHNCK